MAGSASPELLEESKIASREFYMNPASYGALSYTRDYLRIMGCIEPRDPGHQEPGGYKIIMQTGGGDFGEALDEALVTLANQKQVITFPEAMARNNSKRPFTVFDVHYDCAFDAAKVQIAQEMARPSDLTKLSVAEWAEHFNETDHVQSTLGAISVSAAVHADKLEAESDNDLHAIADNLYPSHKNVYPCKEQPKLSRTYVINLHPHVGKNRNKKPADPCEAQKIQAYNDTLAANVSDLAANNRMSKVERGYRLTAMLLRSAATRTLITAAYYDEFLFLDVLPSQNDPGLVVVERKFQ
jgi:hypothetical protein